MSGLDWNEHYERGATPWDTGEPERPLIDLVEAQRIRPGRALEVGCGTGTSALWLADKGFDVLGLDLAPKAIERARAKAPPGARVRFEVVDFLKSGAPEGPFDFVFDCGCFHVFEDPGDQALFASRVEGALAEDGQWLSLLGSTEGPPRDVGPPRRTAREIIAAVEPALELVELRSMAFANTPGGVAMGWILLARKRRTPAQPSTRWRRGP